jgi:hypothetical protein
MTESLIDAVRTGAIINVLNDRKKLCDMAYNSMVQYNGNMRKTDAHLLLPWQSNRKFRTKLQKSTLKLAETTHEDGIQRLKASHNSQSAVSRLSYKYKQLQAAKQAEAASQDHYPSSH